MQSFLAIIIFYGVGFGLGGTIGPLYFIPIVFGIYLFQVLYSNLWLRKFNYGPLNGSGDSLLTAKSYPYVRKRIRQHYHYSG